MSGLTNLPGGIFRHSVLQCVWSLLLNSVHNTFGRRLSTTIPSIVKLLPYSVQYIPNWAIERWGDAWSSSTKTLNTGLRLIHFEQGSWMLWRLIHFDQGLNTGPRLINCKQGGKNWKFNYSRGWGSSFHCMGSRGKPLTATSTSLPGSPIIGSALQKAQYCHDPTKMGGWEALSLTPHSESPAH